jgi:hypothetical protein
VRVRRSAEEVIAAQSRVLVVPWPPKLTIKALPWMPFVDGVVIVDQALAVLLTLLSSSMKEWLSTLTPT